MRNKILSAIIAILFSISVQAQLQKINLPNEDAYVNQHFKDDFKKLTDGDITTRYTVWSPPVTPYQIVFPFYDYDTVAVKQLKYRFNTGNPSTVKFYYTRKSDGQKILLNAYFGGGWDPSWRTVDVPGQDAKNFIIESMGGDDFPDDLETWGNYKESTRKNVVVPKPLGDLFGVVVKPWDIAADFIFPEKLKVMQDLGANRIRLYNDYQLCHDANGNLIENASNWDQAINMSLLKSKGITTQMCYLALPSDYPWPPTGDRSDPATYMKLAQDVFWFGTKNKAGGEYFKTFELLNEQNCWYCGATSPLNFDGYQLAAMCSIAYDGHKGKYPGVGLKASGSTAEFSIGGLAEAEPYLIYQIMEWSAKNRGYRADGTIDLPFDVYSFHLYSSAEGQRQGIPGGSAPEYGAVPYMKKMAKIRDRFFPWLKIRVGEWGWDINSQSSLNAPAFGNYTAHQTSAMWTARDILWMAATGIDGSSYFRIKQDYDPQSDGDSRNFETMALIRDASTNVVKQPDGSYRGIVLKRTLTGDYFKQESNVLSNGYVFDSLVSQSPIVMRFKKTDSVLYAIWEREDMTITTRPQFTEKTGTYNLNVKGILRRFVDDSSGVMSSEVFSGGNINYGSKPVFVITPAIQLIPVPIPIPITKQVDKGYFTSPFTNKREYFLLYEDSSGVLTVKKTNAKYQPL